MAGAIYCGFSRVAVYTIAQKHSLPNGNMNPGWREKLISEYNNAFQGYSAMQFPSSHKQIALKITAIKACFHRRWNPSDNKREYLKTFSVEAWKSLSMEAKKRHSLSACIACDCNYSLISATFPVRSKAKIL